LTVVHVLVCLFLIVVVLLQSGKSADIAGTFGGAGSQTAFGPRGAATLLSKATTGAAVLFMITALTLSIISSRRTGGASVLGTESPKQSAPAKTAPTPATSGGASQNSQQPPKK
jgi:preprotein translocase subunit SecG